MSLLPGYCIHDGCERPRLWGLEVCYSHNKVELDKERDASKPVKAKIPIQRISPKQQDIKTLLRLAYEQKAIVTNNQDWCSGCKQSHWHHRDHSISQKRCKELGKPELIYNLDNFEYSCANCHAAWEGFKSGEFRKHRNFESRMAFMKIHDYQGYIIRMEVVEMFNRPKQTI